MSKQRSLLDDLKKIQSLSSITVSNTLSLISKSGKTPDGWVIISDKDSADQILDAIAKLQKILYYRTLEDARPEDDFD